MTDKRPTGSRSGRWPAIAGLTLLLVVAACWVLSAIAIEGRSMAGPTDHVAFWPTFLSFGHIAAALMAFCGVLVPLVRLLDQAGR